MPSTASGLTRGYVETAFERTAVPIGLSRSERTHQKCENNESGDMNSFYTGTRMLTPGPGSYEVASTLKGARESASSTRRRKGDGSQRRQQGTFAKSARPCLTPGPRPFLYNLGVEPAEAASHLLSFAL